MYLKKCLIDLSPQSASGINNKEMYFFFYETRTSTY